MVFGRNIRIVNKTIQKYPLKERPEIIEKMISFLKKETKRLLAQSHPDKGGSGDSFNRIKVASSIIQEYLQNIQNVINNKIAENEIEEKNKRSNWIVIE